MDKHDGGPAFAHGNPEQGGDPGMTLRDYFAGQALTGLIVRKYGINAPHKPPADAAAEAAYNLADAMLKERESTNER